MNSSKMNEGVGADAYLVRQNLNFAKFSKTGVIGGPTYASAELGESYRMQQVTK
jgi:creatinine amidohydrolase/Fe(II)-dependent formamide hydrolase-like protein